MSRYYRVKTLMLKGEKGDTGYSITNIQMNDDYTLTITIENGMHFNTPPIRGEKGERGACIRSVELRDDYSLLFTLDNGETLETTAILGKEFENIRTLEASASSASKIATSASASASASAQSASQASISASESARNASTSASASAQSATNASQSATNAQVSASSASTSAGTATSKATEASTLATKAKESETNAKLSETNASNSATEAKASAVNAKASETKAEEYANNLQNSTETISKLNDALVNQKKAISELSDKKITKFYAGNLGETHIADSDNGLIQDMMIYGKSSQDGTPSVENPVEIKSVVNPTVKVTNKDELKVQSVTLNNITLNAIPVSSGGTVTINGQQYIADYVDAEKGKSYRKVKRLNMKDVDSYFILYGVHSNGCGYLAVSIDDGSANGIIISNKYKGSAWTMKTGNVYIPNGKSIIFVDDRFTDKTTAIGLIKDTYVIYELQAQVEEDLASEQVEALKMLSTYYPVTNIMVSSEQLDGYAVFNYPISLANGWNYVKQQLNDNRDYIYDMDLQSAEAYVNSEYAVTLTELGV